MTLKLTIDPSDPTPAYEQLRRQIAGPIAAGTLTAGTHLPTVRQLAADLGIATGTVMRAYTELDEAGLIVKRRGGGSVVAEQRDDPDPHSALRQISLDFVSRARSVGASDAQIISAIDDALLSG